MMATKKTIADLLMAAVRHLQNGQPTAAAAFCQRAVALDPAHSEGLYLLGHIAGVGGRHGLASRQFERALAVAPGKAGLRGVLVDALANDAVTRGAAGQREEAATAWRRAIELAPDTTTLVIGLGKTLIGLNRRDRAWRAFRRACELDPGSAAILFFLAGTTEAGDPGVSALFRRCLVVQPDHAEGASTLSVMAHQSGRTGEALAFGRRAVAAEPHRPEILSNLGMSFLFAGQADEAAIRFRRALMLGPDLPPTHSNLLMALQYNDMSPLALLAEHRRFDARHGRPRSAGQRGHTNSADPGRRLRVGYLSPDFRQHVASCFFEPLLNAHNAADVETFCYSDTGSPDAVTARLRARAGHWCDSAGLDESALDARIRADAIDILVDLAGHSAFNRLSLFARRPAPIQITWLGYPDTTGLSAMDYRLVDAITDPPGDADALASETLLRLPGGFLCCQPPVDASEPGPLPGAVAGRITFGSFNNLAKINRPTVALWAAVLRAVPGARLLLKAMPFADTAVQDRVRADFAAWGIAAARLELAGWTAGWAGHLALYRDVDVALDPTPYNGTTTTWEALWMGVPVISLCGQRHAARVGASLLTRVGLGELVATDTADFVAKAAGLAGDIDRLAGLRAGMRARLAASPLMDTAAFARSVEAAYRQVWRNWCARRP
jgi:predicted O-linked N-acetylglucosamine transferase (SPINDLY family)